MKKLLRVDAKTYQQLADKGRWNESMDTIILRVLDDAKRCGIQEEQEEE